MRSLNRIIMAIEFVRFLSFAALCACVACSGARRVQQDVTVIEEYFPTSVLMKSTLQQVTTAEIRECLWSGTRCALRKDFVGSLPSLLGQPTTASARALAKAVDRQSLCANITTQSECQLSYSCSWDTTTGSCFLADLLDLDDINGTAYCPGSRMDAAVHCAALTTVSEEACSSSPYNCTLVGSSSLPGGLFGLQDNLLKGVMPAGSMGERLFSMALSQVPQFAAMRGVSDITDGLSKLLGGVQASGSSSSLSSDSKVCVASWLQDGTFMGDVGTKLLKAVGAGSDLLSAILSDELLGSCAGTQRFREAVRNCTKAVTAESCAAAPGCAWMGPARACVVAENMLPSLVLDSKDKWVSYLSNATRRCLVAINEADCKVADTHVAAGYFDYLTNATTNGSGNGGVTIDITDGAGAMTVSLWSLATGLLVTVLMLVPRFEWL